MMRGLRFVFRARRADQSGNDAVYSDVVAGKVIRKRAGEADNSRFRGHNMGAVFRTGMRAQSPDADDGSRSAFPQRRKTGFCAVKRSIEGAVEDFAPLGVAHLAERLFPPQRRIIDENIDSAELLYR